MSERPWTRIPGSRLDRYWSAIFEHFDPSEWMLAFHEVHERLWNREFWILFGEIWTGDESQYLHNDRIREILTPRRMKSRLRRFCMKRREWSVYQELPEKFEMFRGCWSKNKEGWSWTLSKDVALGFAGSPPEDGYPVLISGAARKEDVVAYFGILNEKEIVIDPLKVIDACVESVAQKDFEPGLVEYQNKVQSKKFDLYSPEKLAARIKASGTEVVVDDVNEMLECLEDLGFSATADKRRSALEVAISMVSD